MNVVRRDAQGKLHFCFQYIDLLLDALLEQNIRPIVELGLMPDELASEKEYVFWWKMNKSMPKEMGEWYEMVETFVRHVTYRYGEEEVLRWYFEVWNEPNHPAFFTESKNIEAYFRLYDQAAKAVKAVNEAYRVGGPATAGMAWVKEIIAHCREKGIPLDFVSSHIYGVRGDGFDADGTKIVYLTPVDQFVKRIQDTGEICHREGLPLFVTEWSNSFSGRDFVHDSYLSAPYLLHVVKNCEGYVDLLSYWVYTDIFEEHGAPNEPFHGGFGLINVQSIPKPIYRAYGFLHRLGDQQICCEDWASYVCRDENKVQILCWNLKLPKQDCHNRKFFATPLPAVPLDPLEFELTGLLSERDYTLCVETIGYRSGDVYSAYVEHGFTELPTREETDWLEKKSIPEKKEYVVRTDKTGKLSFTLPQQENQVDFVEISLGE